MSDRRILDHDKFDGEFPEKFDWRLCRNMLAEDMGFWLSKRIEDDLKTKDRLYVPGLRAAMIVLAEHAMYSW